MILLINLSLSPSNKLQNQKKKKKKHTQKSTVVYKGEKGWWIGREIGDVGISGGTIGLLGFSLLMNEHEDHKFGLRIQISTHLGILAL